MAIAETPKLLDIEVAYANSHGQTIVALKVAANCHVEMAIRQSGLLTRFPEIDLTTMPVGIFSKRIDLNTPLQQNDRIEIYRKLLIDPKQARRSRAETKKVVTMRG